VPSHWGTTLVTGASGGIGLAFAELLAARGSDLVLVARSRDRLEDVAADLRAGHGRSVEVLVADLTDTAQLRSVEDRLADSARPVDLLVNNAGFGSRGAFASLPIDNEEQEILLNLLAPVRLTRAALPSMIRQGHGGVVNVSSLAGLQPLPFWATYSATKSYLTTFSLALHEEVRDQGVHVLALMPGFTHTGFHDRSGMSKSIAPSAIWMSATRVAEAALSALDHGRATCVPGLGYRVFAAATRFIPGPLSRRVVARGQHRSAAG
jgi:short-subunit dehydrogenase